MICKICKDDLKNGGKMLDGLQKPKELQNKENIKKLESVAKELVKDDKSF